MKRDIRLKAVYPHPPELVWEALTDPGDIGQWLMKNDFEPTVGHEFTFRTDPAPGFDGIVHCKVLEVEEHRRLSYTWKGGPVDTVLTFDLERVDAGTILHVTHAGFTGFKAVLTSLILGAGSKKIYRKLLPAVLDRKAGKTGADAYDPTCDKAGFWKVLAIVFAPILGAKEGMGRTLFAALLAGVVLFAFNAFSWLALPFHADSLTSLPDAATEQFVAALPATGVYHYPGHTDDEDEMKRRMERAKEGPVITMAVISKEGIDMMAPGRFLWTLLIDVAAAVAAALVLRRVRGGFAARFGVIFLLALFVAFTANAQNWLWWTQPAGFAVAGIVDVLLGWAVAGAVLAAMVRPAPDA